MVDIGPKLRKVSRDDSCGGEKKGGKSACREKDRSDGVKRTVSFTRGPEVGALGLAGVEEAPTIMGRMVVDATGASSSESLYSLEGIVQQASNYRTSLMVILTSGMRSL